MTLFVSFELKVEACVYGGYRHNRRLVNPIRAKQPRLLIFACWRTLSVFMCWIGS